MMSPFRALLCLVLEYLAAAGPEIRERCTDTTYQKHQALISQIEEAIKSDYGPYPAHDVTDGDPLIPGLDMVDIVTRALATFEKQEATAEKRDAIMEGLVKSMDKISATLFEIPGAPAA